MSRAGSSPSYLRTTKTEYAPFAKMAINNYNAHSEGVGVGKFYPETN
jgi:hypothetical protein